MLPYESYLVPIARKLRKSMTYSERILWNHLKNYGLMGYDFDRQKPVLKYIVDFYCSELMLALEVDGITHHDDGAEAQLRQMEIESLGVTFFRFDSLEIKRNPSLAIDSLIAWIQEYEEKNGVIERVKKRRGKE